MIKWLKQLEFSAELARVCCNPAFAVLIGGYFNPLRFSSEKSKVLKSNRHIDLFNLVINKYVS